MYSKISSDRQLRIVQTAIQLFSLPLLPAGAMSLAHTAQHSFSPALQQTLSQVQHWSLVVKDTESGQYWGYHPEDWSVDSIPD